MNYERVLSYGHIFPLKITCNPDKLLNEVEPFTFAQYNTKKTYIDRRGLSITSLDGETNGPDLESLNGSTYDELSFRTLTRVYHASSQIQKLVDPFKQWIGRTHILNIRKGGYFPPHRDELSEVQRSFRILVPLRAFNPPENYFIFNGDITSLNEGRAYFINTNITHSDFSFSNDTMMIVLNVECTAESHYALLANVQNL